MAADDSLPVQRLTVTKLDSAARQFETAISLWFHDGDAVAIHTLVAAAHQVCHGIAKSKGMKSPFLFNEALHPSPDQFKRYKKFVTQTENFFKHANDDPDPSGSLTFDVTMTDLYLIDGLELYHAVSGTLSVPMRIFRNWFRIHYPFAFDRAQEILNEPEAIKLRSASKQVFFRELFEIFSRIQREGSDF
jgi:hypothetical protein